ncbi:MAG: hypothetical protein DRR19_04820 [Candidatus Parabeggiatoa sp. nov. 1]|nr:MAG: hypothetical protein DRR19_04820 [Gammaproteobacteria bacterium]
MAHNNPFIYGNPVAPEQLIGRDKELRHIARRIGTGQSTIITGSPRCGKTSVLDYLSAPEKQVALYGDEADNLVFSYLGAYECGPEFSQAQFWHQVLRPLQERIVAQGTDSPLFKAYQIGEENHFESYELGKLIAQIKKANWRLVLLIDEFDSLLHHPILNSAEFFGGLRTQVSRGKNALVLVITANISRSQFHEKTQRLNPMGSPYFNFTEEVVLGALPDTEIDKLLHQGDAYFTDEDRSFLKEVAGGHPYLLKVAASNLWAEYEHGNEKKPIKRQQRVRQLIFDKFKEYSLQKEKSDIIVGDDDEMLKNLSNPIFIAFMFVGTLLGERVGYLLTNKSFLFEAEPLSIHVFKFGCAALGAFLGYKIAKLKLFKFNG